MIDAPRTRTPGPILFARYAYPPNELGYCGADAPRTLLEYVDAGTTDGGLEQLDRSFDGAWPYLELIAGGAGIDDPLDARVVEAYWIGGPMLRRVAPGEMLRSLDDRFRRHTGTNWGRVAATVAAGAVAHHSFHVLAVYPWVGLLRSGTRDHALHVLDRCRIRAARVLTTDGTEVTVRTQRIVFEGDRLTLGEPCIERATLGSDGYRLAGDEVRTGDHVSLHWDWVCDRLDERAVRRLDAATRHNLELVNRHALPSAPPSLVGAPR